MKTYHVIIQDFYVEAEDEEDAMQQALSMIEEGAIEIGLLAFDREDPNA